MRTLTIIRLSLLLIFITSIYSYSQNLESSGNESSLLLRPNGNIGFLEDEFVTSCGIRFLLSAGGNKVYGIEFSYFQREEKDNNFYTAGIVIEQKLFNWFNMAIGTIGYFNFDKENRNLAGLMTNLGWEPNTLGQFSPFITYRSDFIFDNKIKILNMLNVGLNIKI